MTTGAAKDSIIDKVFQYRKRYEVTCDTTTISNNNEVIEFQYRKRYEVTCDSKN